MSTNREDEPPRHMRPPERLLSLFGLQNEVPEEVYCASCSERNDGKGVFLFTRYGGWGVDMRNRGRWPDDLNFGEWRGQRRIEWMLCTAKMCDQGHTTAVRQNGTLVHMGNTDDSGPPRVVRARY